MIDVNWNDNAKAAVREFVECVDDGDYLSVSLFPLLDNFLESRPTQTKTVADAVEWANGVWDATSYHYIAYNPRLDRFDYSKEGDVNEKWYLVCTCAEFEAYLKEQEDEKWTHTLGKEKCNIVTEYKDNTGSVCCLFEDGYYAIVNYGELKPIKPTISQDQAKAVMEFATEHGLISEGQIWTSMEREII